MNVFGLRIIFTLDATKETTERLFPASCHRSARIRKKLIKRHGGEFKLAPSMYHDRPNATLYAHPAFRREIERQSIEMTMRPTPLFGGGL